MPTSSTQQTQLESYRWCPLPCRRIELIFRYYAVEYTRNITIYGNLVREAIVAVVDGPPTTVYEESADTTYNARYQGDWKCKENSSVSFPWGVIIRLFTVPGNQKFTSYFPSLSVSKLYFLQHLR